MVFERAFFQKKVGIKFFKNKLDVLQTNGLILSFFFKVLGVSLYFLPDAIDKNHRLSGIYQLKVLKFVLQQTDNTIVLNPIFVLLPLVQDSFFKKFIRKKILFLLISASNFEKVLALSKEVITFHIGVFIIKVGLLSLEKSSGSTFLL